jgi:hypothetical protein
MFRLFLRYADLRLIALLHKTQLAKKEIMVLPLKFSRLQLHWKRLLFPA